MSEKLQDSGETCVQEYDLGFCQRQEENRCLHSRQRNGRLSESKSSASASLVRDERTLGERQAGQSTSIESVMPALWHQLNVI
jgi:hypothetical protein